MATITQTATIPIPRGAIATELNFYQDPSDGSVPFNVVDKEAFPDLPDRNFEDDPHNITVNDFRGQESRFTLDKNAFQGLQGIQSQEKDFTDDEHIKSVYYPEVEKLILDHVPGANRVLLFDHTIRRSTPGASRAPVNRVHIDQTAKSSAERVTVHLPDEAEKLLQGRYRIINVWRPINGPVYGNPLGFADASTVKEEDLIPIQHKYATRDGQTAGVKFNKGQDWYYWSGMTNDERLLIECFDSENPLGRVPHSAFKDSRTPLEAPGRESIEVRALVFG
jgi:hypothetical protein